MSANMKVKYIRIIVFPALLWLTHLNNIYHMIFADSPHTHHTHTKMVSRRKILSRSRDDLNLDQTFTQQEEEEDVWYQKDKLYKVSDHNLLERMQFISIMRVRWQLAISWKRLTTETTDGTTYRRDPIEAPKCPSRGKWRPNGTTTIRTADTDSAQDSSDFRLASCCCCCFCCCWFLLWFVAIFLGCGIFSTRAARPHWGQRQHMKRTKTLAAGAAAAASSSCCFCCCCCCCIDQLH